MLSTKVVNNLKICVDFSFNTTTNLFDIFLAVDNFDQARRFKK